ncbi:Zinc finger A20 and AN1 domain-containing stress-associated protein 4 [Capsicum chinense]|nr:Zinc finger A20 and AN1 domain-containing stress-associated protein 4 [Capsicum chinense]
MYWLLLKGDGNRVMDYFAWFGCIELWKVDMISNPKRWEVHLGLVLNVDSQCIYDEYVFQVSKGHDTTEDVVRRSSSSDESELGLAGAAVASVDLASQISQVKSKEDLKKCTACRKRVGLTGFSCKCGDLFCAVHPYSDKHNCSFDYRNAGQNAIAKENPIIVEEKLNKM